MKKNSQRTPGNRYQIEIKEQLDKSWTEWFSNFDLAHSTDNRGNPVTILSGMVIDQAALNGLLTKIWNLNLTVLSVKRID